MKLATTTADFDLYEISQEDSVRYIHQAGFRFVDYNFGSDYKLSRGFMLDDWRAHGARMNALADSLGVRYIQAQSPMGRPLVRDDEHEGFIAATKRCIEACAVLGVTELVVHSGYAYGISKDDCFEQNRAFYLDLLSVAETCGVNILVENFNKMHREGVYWIDNATDLRALIDFIDHPLLHACWDVGHANLQEMPQDEELRIMGSHIRALHVQDNYGATDDHVIPFSGTTSMDSLMHGLMDIGYKGYFTFESCNILKSRAPRRPFEKDTRLFKAPLPLRVKAEELIYAIGKYTLEAYDCFEE